jgi:hypothetical protein
LIWLLRFKMPCYHFLSPKTILMLCPCKVLFKYSLSLCSKMLTDHACSSLHAFYFNKRGRSQCKCILSPILAQGQKGSNPLMLPRKEKNSSQQLATRNGSRIPVSQSQTLVLFLASGFTESKWFMDCILCSEVLTLRIL